MPPGTDKLDELLSRARRAWDRMTPDQRAHMHHAQRSSFAIGNLLIDKPDADAVIIAMHVRAAAGPCPCMACELGRQYRGYVHFVREGARGWTAVKTGHAVSGEIG